MIKNFVSSKTTTETQSILAKCDILKWEIYLDYHFFFHNFEMRAATVVPLFKNLIKNPNTINDVLMIEG